MPPPAAACWLALAALTTKTKSNRFSTQHPHPPHHNNHIQPYTITITITITRHQVNYVGKAANLYEDAGYSLSGAAYVAEKHLSTSWLWDRVRVVGGAYGGFCSFDSHSGLFTYLSYRGERKKREGGGAWVGVSVEGRRGGWPALCGFVPDAAPLVALPPALPRRLFCAAGLYANTQTHNTEHATSRPPHDRIQSTFNP